MAGEARPLGAKAYENSLAALFFLFFLGSWLCVAHAAGGARA